MLAIGLDVGSSSIKGGVLDLDTGEVRGVVKELFPEPLAGQPAGHFEIPLPAIVEGVGRVLTRLLADAPDAKGVFVSGQMGGVVLVDDAGRPLSNYLSWRDQRTLAFPPSMGGPRGGQSTTSAAPLNPVVDGGKKNTPSPSAGRAGVGAGEQTAMAMAHPPPLNPPADGGRRSYIDEVRSLWSDDVFAELGRELQPGSASTLLYWLAQQRRLPRSPLIASVADAAIAQLCGCVPKMHPTQAIGLLNLRERDWHRAAFDALGLADVRFPAIADESQPVGTLQPPFPPIPCYAAFGDQQCALYGADLSEDELSINVSTGSQVSRRTSVPLLGEYQTRAYFDGGYLNTITHLPAGRSLNVLMDLLTELPRRAGLTISDAWRHVSDALAAADGGGLVCDLAFFKGPFGERGSIAGITTENLTIGNIFHAAIEAMVANYARCIDRIWPTRDFARIALAGGLTHALPRLREQIADRLSPRLREPAAGEETLLGLLKIARKVT